MNKEKPLEVSELCKWVVAGEDCLQPFLATDADANVSTYEEEGHFHFPGKDTSLWKLSLLFLSFFIAIWHGLGYLNSPTKDWTWASEVKAPSPNSWTTREFPYQSSCDAIIHGNLKTIAFIIFPTYYLMKHSWQLVIYPSFIRENCSESSVTWTKFYNLWQNVNNSWDYVSSGHSSTPQLLTSPNSDRYTNDLIEDRGFFFFNEW